MDALVRSEPRTRAVRIETPHGAGEMAYLDFGPPERPVDAIFLHANGFNARAYRTILGPLADSIRLLAPDQRGHGATTLPTLREGRADWLDMAADVLAFMNALRIDRAVLAGHSMGGTTSLLAARGSPEKVSALALFDPVIWSPEAAPDQGPGGQAISRFVEGVLRRRRVFASRQQAAEAYRGRGAFATWTEDMLQDYVAAGFRDLPAGGVELACDPDWEVSNYLAQANDSWGALRGSSCPIHVFRAERDAAAQLDSRLAELTASGRIRVETVPGTTHFLPMERPDIVRAAIREAVG